MKNIKDMLMGVVDVYGNHYKTPIKATQAMENLFSRNFGAMFRKIRPDVNIGNIYDKINVDVYKNHTGSYVVEFSYRNTQWMKHRKGNLIKLLHSSFFDLQTKFPDTFVVGDVVKEERCGGLGVDYNHKFTMSVYTVEKKPVYVDVSFVVKKPSKSVPVDFDAIAELIKGRRCELKQKLDEARVSWDDAIKNYDVAKKELNDFNRKFDSY